MHKLGTANLIDISTNEFRGASGIGLVDAKAATTEADEFHWRSDFSAQKASRH